MIIKVLNIEEAEAYEPDPSEVCISITSPTVRAALRDGWQDVLRIQFSDIDGLRWGLTEKQTAEIASTETLFSDDMARQVVAFVRKHWHAKRIIVHCEAGVSRSAGVALALHEILTDAPVPSPLEKYYPLHNRFVRRKVLEAR